MIARFAHQTEHSDGQKGRGWGGEKFLFALAFRRRRISCQRSWRARLKSTNHFINSSFNLLLLYSLAHYLRN